MDLGSNALGNKFLSSGPDMADVLLTGWPSAGLRTSYRTGDEGSRVQNGWFDYTRPIYPAAVSELDYTSTNFEFLLKNDVKVGGVSNKTRFVDVDGGQTFSATGNKNLVLIDKFTGLMWTRAAASAATWNNAIDNALAYSATVNGTVYSDWYLPTIKEYIQMFGLSRTNTPFADENTGVTLITGTAALFWSASTIPALTTSAANFNSWFKYVNNTGTGSMDKTVSNPFIYVRDARALISAP